MEDAMTLLRRQFLCLAAGAAALPAMPRIAMAQVYPARPVRLIVASAAGGSPDIVARLVGQWLSERLGQPFVVENRPGAGGNIGTEVVVRARSDGYTLLLTTATNALNATLYEKRNFDYVRDIAPVAGIVRGHLVMLVNPSVPANSVPELVAYAKSNPGKLNFTSGGNGTIQHIAGELFKMMAGIDMVHVPYRGQGPALTDLIAGQVHVMFNTTPASVEYIRTGKLRALAVTTATRAEELPDIPALTEFVPGYEASAQLGVGAPTNTPPEVISKLNKEINAGLANSQLKARLVELGGTAIPGSPAEFGKLVAAETDKWAKVIKFAGIKAE
jgi:tripartite-type tricarboxylate transporter receptor subunit TctC